MSLFDDDLVTKPLMDEESFQTLAENIYLGMFTLLFVDNAPRVEVLWMDNTSTFQRLINRHILQKQGNASRFSWRTTYELAPNDDIPELRLPPALEAHRGRSVLSLDCSKLKRGDVNGFFNILAQIPSSPAPIIIIENLTNIPTGDQSIYDDPAEVENRLLHGWNSYPSAATILIHILKSEKDKLNLGRLRNNNYAQVDFSEDIQKWTSVEFKEMLRDSEKDKQDGKTPWLLKKELISKAQLDLAIEYLKKAQQLE